MDGEVEIFWNKDSSATVEQIPDAGLEVGDRGYPLKMPNRASVAKCLLAGMGMGIAWLVGIVFIFSTFRDPVMSGATAAETDLAVSLSFAAYLLADLLMAAGIPAVLSPKYRSFKAAICLIAGSIVPIAILLTLLLRFGNLGMLR